MNIMKHLKILFTIVFLWAITLFAQDKPNVLVIWGDDVGWANVSKYNLGVMGYKTPNIDRIADEGAMFTDWYSQQSCTAGRAAFILGQHPFRTGLLTIGMPGSKQGIGENMPTIADLLKDEGYTSGQFGKNHLGDRDEHLPTMALMSFLEIFITSMLKRTRNRTTIQKILSLRKNMDQEV